MTTILFMLTRQMNNKLNLCCIKTNSKVYIFYLFSLNKKLSYLYERIQSANSGVGTAAFYKSLSNFIRKNTRRPHYLEKGLCGLQFFLNNFNNVKVLFYSKPNVIK